MKIVFFRKNWISDQAINCNLFQRLYSLGSTYEVNLITRGDSFIGSILQKKVKIWRSPPRFNVWFLGDLIYYFYCLLWVFKLKKNKIDLIITDRSIISLFGFIARIFTGVKWVADIWDDPEKESYYLWRKYSIHWYLNKCKIKLLKKILRYADLVICSILPEKLKDYNISKETILAVPNCIDLELVKPLYIERNKNEFRIVFVGLVRKDRGLDTLLKAVKKLLRDIPNLRLILIGDPNIETVKEMVTELCLGKWVELYGRVEHEKVLTQIESADVCVCPFMAGTDIEYTYPIKILEYLGMDKVVIASNLKGIRTIIKNGENGLLVKPGDREELSGTILKVYRDKELRRKLEHNARKSAFEYDYRKKNKIINEKLNKLVGQ